MTSPLLFDIIFPQGPLSTWLQAIWSAQIPMDQKSVTRRLIADAGSGLLFNLGQPISIDHRLFSDQVMFQPTNKQAHIIQLSPGTELVGVRFQPGMGRLFLEKMDEGSVISDSPQTSVFIQSVFKKLEISLNAKQRMSLLNEVFDNAVDSMNHLPDFVEQATELLQQSSKVDMLGMLPLSQRQIERQFQSRLSMSPKYFQRLRRVRAVLLALQQPRKHTKLAELALEYGFADQAHMTRECHLIAGITPSRYIKGKLEQELSEQAHR
ncbi:helix-turn-helix domain-containing protein [Marinomonas sp. RSW2]|uniref:Helix-turn-helix domain-containing protein n=1 Tax=Marinomonas maritima TaxID=2940935 RepID=A0ABT5WDQ6_9GAMM|nr:helix-turn-helix domain-containing protein [Marinomonas maritima]MDE8602933.1 helix-turn-helix domain-containing protein [Marinomonas maritima]